MLLSAAKVWWPELSQLSFCSAFDKENSIEFSLDLVHYIYMQSNPNPVLLFCTSLWVNLLSCVCWYYNLKEKKKKRKTIFKNKRKEKKRKRNNDLADLPSHDIPHCFLLSLFYPLMFFSLLLACDLELLSYLSNVSKLQPQSPNL